MMRPFFCLQVCYHAAIITTPASNVPSILALDQGTHASRACLFNAAGDMLFTHTENISLNRIDAHRVEQDPQQIIRSLQDCIAAAIEAADRFNSPIGCCGLAIQRSSVLAWRPQGEALSPVLSWQDTRGASQLESLRHRKRHIQALTGLPLSPHYGASKLAWLRRQFATRNPLRLSPLVSHVLFHLLATSPYLCDPVNAQRTQLFALQQGDWSARLCDWFGVPQHLLPACRPVLRDYGQLRQAAIPLTAVSGDQNAALFGAGEPPADTALVNIGSGAFVLQLLDDYQNSDKQLTGIACSDSRHIRYLREATVNGAGNALQWLQQGETAIGLHEHLDGWLQQTDPSLIFVNSIGGLGSPWWNNHIPPRFINLSPGGDKPAPLQQKAVALVESIVFMLHANLEIMQRQQAIARLQVSGGLSQLDGLCQRLANLTGLAVERSTLTGATARGIAWLAAGRPGEWQETGRPQHFLPDADPGLHRRYRHFLTAIEGNGEAPLFVS